MTAVAALRARSQRLNDRARDPADLVRELMGAQAQDAAAARLSIRARTDGVDRAAVDAALESDRSVVRTWAMRGTIHLVAAEDVGWLTALLAPLSVSASDRRLAQLGVPAGDRPRALEAIRSALAEHGPLTRAELMEHVAGAGVETAGQAGAHLTRLAALEGLACLGPERGGKATFVLLDDWLRDPPRELTRERALGELASRYLRAYGPAAPEDLAAWSGLPLRDARAGWEAIAPAPVAAGPGWLPADRERWLRETPPEPPVTRLLPAFDTYLLGYRTRAAAVPDEHARTVAPGGGIVRPTVVANGRAVATWRQVRRGRRLSVAVEPFAGAAVDRDAVEREVADIGRFTGEQASLAD